jgi:hypothetical protein
MYIARTIHWWRAVCDCMGHGNTCSGSYNVGVHLPCEDTVAHLPCDDTMAHLPCEGRMAHLLVIALWHICFVIIQ